MPNALAIETSGRTGSIALARDGQTLHEETFPHGLKHAAEIIPIIDRLTRAQSWSPADIDELYVSAGPGSFTGLRIGITLAKTLALATGLKVVPVPSLRVLVENAAPDAQTVILVLDAKRDHIFTARYERSPEGWLEREPARLDSLTQMLSRAPRPVHLLGEGIPYHQKFIPLDPTILITDESAWHARASVVARLGHQLARDGKFADIDRLTPIYIRPPEAEERLGGAASAAVEASRAAEAALHRTTPT